MLSFRIEDGAVIRGGKQSARAPIHFSDMVMNTISILIEKYRVNFL
jgi:hypothetical protein